MRQRILVACAVVLLAAGAVAFFGGEDGPEPAPKRTVLVPDRPGDPNETRVAGPSEAAPPTAAEVRFVQMMIPHHAQALEMSGLAPSRASDERVRSLASRIEAAQKVEIDAMRSWLDENPEAVLKAHGDGHGGRHTAGNMAGMATPRQLERLRGSTGAAFDELFLQLMITHHQGAITMVDDVLDKGTDVTVQEMARDVQSTQAAEIERMRGLLDG
ncbi:DUF305 domain-containing protein [Actinomadura rifamycini]|uniref:DUF305 domain-containing protein n=1 Tax=Actinomadura rifamycini TaxID=31962 RepID=UPI00041C46AC|nr:DUF305 domain-containing protein [Actinomadura rifamycini]